MTEWTEADKAAHMLFVQQMRDLLGYAERAGMLRVELSTSEIRSRLKSALDRLGAR